MWAASTVLAFTVCIKGYDYSWIKTIINWWGVISCIFIGGKILIDALAEAIKKAEIKASLELRGGIGK